MRPRSDAGPASSALSTSSQLPFNASLSSNSMGTCPIGGQWYACPTQSPTFFGCCVSNACNGIGCPNTDLRAAGMGTATGPNQGVNDGSYWPNIKCSIGQWWTCSNQTPSFQGCCDNNPCNGDGSGCAAGQLHPAEFLNGTAIATAASFPVSTTPTLSSSLTAPTPSSTGSVTQAPPPIPSPTTKSTPRLNSSQGSSIVTSSSNIAAPIPDSTVTVTHLSTLHSTVTSSSNIAAPIPDSTVTVTHLSTLHSTVTTYTQTSSPSPKSTSQTPSNIPISQSTSTSISSPPSSPTSPISPTTEPTRLLTISTSPSPITTLSTIDPTTLLTISASPSSTLSLSSASLTQTQLATPTASGLTNALSSTSTDPNRKAKIIGGAIGGVLLLLLILLAAWYSRRRYRKMADERRARLNTKQSVSEGDFAVPYSNFPVSKTPPQLTTEPPYPMSPLANHRYPPEESSPGSAPQLPDPFPPHVGHFLSQPSQYGEHDGDLSSTAGMYGGDDPPSLWNRNMDRPPRPWDFNRDGNTIG